VLLVARRGNQTVFNFYLYYFIYYFLGAVALVAGLIACWWLDLPAALLWTGWCALLLWVFGYHAFLIRMQYRRLREILAQLSDLAAHGKRPGQDEAVRLVMDLGGDQSGMPEFLVRYLVRRFYRT
jgi:hypothetical protein